MKLQLAPIWAIVMHMKNDNLPGNANILKWNPKQEVPASPPGKISAEASARNRHE